MLDFDGMIADIKSNTGSCFMTVELHHNFMPGLNSWIMRQVQEQATLVIVGHKVGSLFWVVIDNELLTWAAYCITFDMLDLIVIGFVIN